MRWRRRSRRAGGEPARRCVTTTVAVVVPPPRAAMLRAPTRSRCPRKPQWAQAKRRPRGLETRSQHCGHVEEVPRSSTRTTLMPASWALSASAPSRWVRRQVLATRRFWRRPEWRWAMPLGSPTTKVPTPCAPAQAMTSVAASWCIWCTRRRCLASALRWAARSLRHRREPRWPRRGALAAMARERALVSARCRRSSARIARPETNKAAALGQEGDRAHLLGLIGHLTGQAEPQVRTAPGDREADPGSLHCEGPGVVAQRNQSPAPAWIARPPAGPLAPRRLHGRIGITA
jgi:hypothetical protein